MLQQCGNYIGHNITDPPDIVDVTGELKIEMQLSNGDGGEWWSTDPGQA